MSSMNENQGSSTGGGEALAALAARSKKRRNAEMRFRLYGIGAIVLALAMLGVLFISIFTQGWPAFTETRLRLDVNLDPAIIDPSGTREHDTLLVADYTSLVRKALRAYIPVDNRQDRRRLYALISKGSDLEVRDVVMDDPSLIGTTQPIWLLASGDVDSIVKGAVSRDVPENRRQINDLQLSWIDKFDGDGRMKQAFNLTLFSAGASSDPELAGIASALAGSAYMLLIVLALALPIGVAAAVHLEEFAPTNRWTDLIEVNINNLAAVPSIVFGILGLAVFINFFGLPRSASLVGGLVLTLMTLPTVIIATRAALKAVPPSIREAALGVGASKMQTVTHHVLPLAMPGILTGTIIGMAQALGETAPLLMIGMVAFIVDQPATPLDPATALPVQIFMWAGAPERAFVARTSAAIIVLLGFLVVMNATAVWLRSKFERRW